MEFYRSSGIQSGGMCIIWLYRLVCHNCKAHAFFNTHLQQLFPPNITLLKQICAVAVFQKHSVGRTNAYIIRKMRARLRMTRAVAAAAAGADGR
jgi:hypothetical protein